MAMPTLPARACRLLRATFGSTMFATLFTGCGQDAHHLASIASKLGRQIAAGSERVRETALGRLFQNRSVLEQVPLTDRARIRLRLDRSLQGLDITVRQIESGCLELTGEVPDEAARQAAVQSVQQVPGVEKVADGLKLAGSVPPDEKPANTPEEKSSPQPAPMPGSGLPPPPAVENRNGAGFRPSTGPIGNSTPPPPVNGGTIPPPSATNPPALPGGAFPSPPPLAAPGTIPPAPATNPVGIPPPPPPPRP